MTKTAKPKIRDAEATKVRILAAAKQEFADFGLGGARVDVIAEHSNANKRMIYHYFGSKEALFQTVIEQAYTAIRSAERELELDHLPAAQALEKLVIFTWEYYLENPEFLTLINSENLHRARHLKKSEVVQKESRKFVKMVGGLLKRGETEGVFRKGVDPVQLNLTIAAIGYYYLTNQYTGNIIYDRDLMEKGALRDRLKFNIETIMRLVSA